jgi:Uma2 family endonuclease
MPQRRSREEFRRWAEEQTGRYERIDGQPVAMSAERIQHVRIKNRIWAALDHAIAASGLDCEALGDGVTIEVGENTDYAPDAVVNCGPPAPPDAVAAANPIVVVEVLSPTTQAVDTSDKLADYFRVASIQHYLIVSARRRDIIHHQRNGAEIVSRIVNVGSISLDPPGIAIDLAEIYAGLG